MRVSLLPWLCCLGVAVAVQPSAVADAPSPLPVQIAPDDPNVYYIGRADTRDPKGPRFEWSHSMVTLRFKGTDLQAKIDEEGDDYYDLVVDNAPPQVLHPGKGMALLDLATGLRDAHHTVKLIKRTEAFVGRIQFLGFGLSAGGTLDPPLKMQRRIEVIGDSISCGYGNEAANEHDKFTNATENAAMAYGALAADAVDAEYVCVAWSGKKMWPDNTIPELYDRALPTDAASAWDFAKWTPDVVLINLATNDFGKGNPDKQAWTGAYEAFVRRVRGHYPHALIYLASGSMMTDSWPPDNKALTTLNGYLDTIKSDLAASGEQNVRIIRFEPQNAAVDGIGADYHPSVRTDAKMAAHWVTALQADLGWPLAYVR